MADHQTIMNSLASFTNYEFSWTVENLSKAPSQFQGPVFRPIPDHSWLFYFQLQFDCLGNLYLNVDDEPTHLDLKCNFTFQNTEGKVLLITTTHVKHVNKNNYLDSFNRSDICSTKLPLPDDKLILKGTLLFSGYNVHSTLSKRLTNSTASRSIQVLDDLKTMYRNAVESDVTFHVQGKIIRAHKGIVASRSPVFAKMFTHDMQERNSKKVVIKDIDHHTLDCFLLFLYTGEVEDTTWVTVLKLYFLSDKYEVKSLQQACSQILGDGLKVESACRVLVMAALHSDDELKRTTMDFIRGHFNKVAKTTDWAGIVATKPHLASEVLSSVTSVFAK